MREKLKDWSDPDVAMFALAQSIGLMGPIIDFATAARYTLNAATATGHALYSCLVSLVEAGILEQQAVEDGGTQFRWNPKFMGSWERDDPTLV